MTRRKLTSPESYIPGPPSRAQRERKWDREHPAMVSYRGIDPLVAQQVKALAERLGVPVGEVAQALLGYGLDAVDGGDLKLHPTLKTGRFSLFNENGRK